MLGCHRSHPSYPKPRYRVCRRKLTAAAFIPVDDRMAVLSAGETVPNLWAIGDANGKMMLAQRLLPRVLSPWKISVGRQVDYLSIPAAALLSPRNQLCGTRRQGIRQGGRGLKRQRYDLLQGQFQAIAEGKQTEWRRWLSPRYRKF